MHPQPVREHVFMPILMRAQLVTAGLVLTAGAVLAGIGVVDADSLRHLFGA